MPTKYAFIGEKPDDEGMTTMKGWGIIACKSGPLARSQNRVGVGNGGGRPLKWCPLSGDGWAGGVVAIDRNEASSEKTL